MSSCMTWGGGGWVLQCHFWGVGGTWAGLGRERGREVPLYIIDTYSMIHDGGMSQVKVHLHQSTLSNSDTDLEQT